ncbi:DUF6882 domain-containing protein [Amnibacterium endophyticum]|uniref:DUF6882 domain-containing protein n=1 Tax=Amnibacterium endophyticum TaxID=2109337 RepID=A0ABW4LHT5_9MICO
MPDLDLTALADAGAFVSQEHQEHLAGTFGMRTLSVDPAAGRVAFTDAAGARTVWRAHLLGTASPEDGTWLWAHENVNGFPDAFVQQSRRVRAFGRKHGVEQLAVPRLELDDELPGRLVRAVKALTGLTAHVTAPIGTGSTKAWLLVEDDALRLPPPTVARTVGVVMSGIAGTGVADHRRALTAWAEQRGAVVEPGEGVARVHVSDGTVRVRFDDADRIVGISTGRGSDERAVPGADPAPVPPTDTERPGSEPEAPAESPAEEAAPRRGWLARLLGR